MKRTFAFWLSIMMLLVFSRSALSHELDPEEAGHPVRVAAYLLHPFGYILYHGIFKPAHSFISSPGASEVFGHKEEAFQSRLTGSSTSAEFGRPEMKQQDLPGEQPDQLEQIPLRPGKPKYNFQPRRKPVHE